MSYSQNDEEKYILEAVKDRAGVFLDIGAYNGVTFSNTRALVHRGWSGIFVEPSLKGFSCLLDVYGNDQSRFGIVQVLMGTKRGLVPFWNSLDAVSTSDKKHYDLWKEVAGFSPACYLPQITWADLFDKFIVLQAADVVSIDTEGTSADLFLDFPFELCHPKVFCVEHDQRKDELEAFAKTKGYSLVYTSNENMVFVR